MGPTSGVSLSDKYKNLQNTQIQKKKRKKKTKRFLNFSTGEGTHRFKIPTPRRRRRKSLPFTERDLRWKDVDFSITLQVSLQRTINQLFGKLNTKSRFNLNGINSKFYFSVFFAIVFSCLFVFFIYKKLLTCARFWFDYVLAPFERLIILFQSSRFFFYLK